MKGTDLNLPAATVYNTVIASNKALITYCNLFRIQVIVSGQMDYSDPFVQRQVENLTQTFENTSYISSPLYTESWLRSFLQYAERNEDYLNISLKTEEGFISALKEVIASKPKQIRMLNFSSCCSIG